MSFLFETKRFRLREIVVQDAQAMYELNLDPEVIRYTGDGHWPSVEESRRFIENYPDYRLNQMGRWAVIGKQDGVFYGWCGLKKIGDDVDLGYRFFRKYWGQGIASETARGSRDYGFEHYGLDRLVAHAAIANPASLRVLEKLGFRRIGETTLGGHRAIGFEFLRSDWRGHGT